MNVILFRVFLILFKDIKIISFIYLVIVIFIRNGHIGILLVQLESLSLLLLASIIYSAGVSRVRCVILFRSFCVLVSEATMGVALLLGYSRFKFKELIKFF